MDGLIQLVGGLAGVVIGWLLNECSTRFRTRAKLCFKLTGTPDSEVIEKGLRTKTSASEYSIEIYNFGQSPFIFDQFALYDKGKLLIDCHITEQERTILPYKSMVYTLMEQEANALMSHCKQRRFQDCQVTAFDVRRKKVSAKLDVPLIYLRATILNAQDDIIPPQAGAV